MGKFKFTKTSCGYSYKRSQYRVEYEFYTVSNTKLKAVCTGSGTGTVGIEDFEVRFFDSNYNKRTIKYNADFFLELEYIAYDDIVEMENEIKEHSYKD